MVKQVLTKAGFIEGKTFKEIRFLKPPKSTYAVYLDDFVSRGADGLNLIKEHDYTIELYSSYRDLEAEKNIENAFNELGIEFNKKIYYLDTEQLYQIVYEFEYIEK